VNLIEGRSSAAIDETVQIEWAEGQQAITAQTSRAITAGQKVFYAIRPEKVTISPDRPADAVNAAQGKILDIAYLGNLSTYHVQLPTGQVIKSQMANTRRISRRPYTWEDEVWVSWTKTGGSVLEG
jgi:putrescine transport system ATP-binding protein